MKYRFRDLVDLAKLDKLVQSHYRATGFSSAVTDEEGTVLVSAGWQDICTQFHRKHPSTAEACKRAAACVKNCCQDEKPYMLYRCQNGLVGAGAPIIIDGEHLATVFHAQVLLKKPDLAYFKRQAELYGFDETAYLTALDKVPVESMEKLDAIMLYFIEFANMIADLGLVRLRQLERQARKLQKSDEQIYWIFNSTPYIGIQGYDKAGNIVFWNNGSERIYGYEKAEVVGKPLNHLLFDDESAARLRGILNEISITNTVVGPAEWAMKHRNGSDLYVYSTIFPITLSDGKQEFICMEVDITKQKTFAKELERLDRLNLIGEMAASIGHEVRNPMTIVRGYLQMIKNKQCYLEYEKEFDMMIGELDRANLIITDFLSMAKNKTIDRTMLDLNTVIDSLMLLLAAEAKNNNVDLNWVKGAIPLLALDEKEIRQLLINLFKNALEAMPGGGVLTIKTMRESEAVVLEIQDSGGGIPREIADQLGTPFVTTKETGTGLGLAVCFSIAARHNAEITFRSTDGGTTVCVKFPAKQSGGFGN